MSPSAKKKSLSEEQQQLRSENQRNFRVIEGGQQQPAEHPFEYSAVCHEPSCDHLATALGFCRMHYIKNWKRIKLKEEILNSGRLRTFLVELANKYSEKYLHALRHDLQDDESLARVIRELDLRETDDDLANIDTSNAIESYPMDPSNLDVEET